MFAIRNISLYFITEGNFYDIYLQLMLILEENILKFNGLFYNVK